MAAPTPVHTAAASVTSRFYQQTSCTADTWTTLIPQVTVPSSTITPSARQSVRRLAGLKFQHIGTGGPIKFGIRILVKTAGAVGTEFLLVYEDYVTSPEERMSDADTIQGSDTKSCKTFDFSDIMYLLYDYELQYYSSATSGFLVNGTLSGPLPSNGF